MLFKVGRHALVVLDDVLMVEGALQLSYEDPTKWRVVGYSIAITFKTSGRVEGLCWRGREGHKYREDDDELKG